tara:strand:+ start:736 stop:1032 length:297 start_codon:yes stop_codon:yes gene_type:complete
MRAKNENKLIADSYYKTVEEMLGMEPVVDISQPEVVEVPIETGECGGVQPDIAAMAAQAIAAITELATAAGASISVTVDIGEEEIDRFNAGHEDVGST